MKGKGHHSRAEKNSRPNKNWSLVVNIKKESKNTGNVIEVFTGKAGEGILTGKGNKKLLFVGNPLSCYPLVFNRLLTDFQVTPHSHKT